MVKSNSNVKFRFAKTHKSWRKCKPSPFLTIDGFPEDPQLCVIDTLDKNFEMT